MTGRRLPDGGTWIDRSRPIGFTFDGRELTGFEGDTLASALLANGVDVVCRSPILGRPRGIVSAGVEESSAFVEVSEPWFEPIVAATMVNLVDGLRRAADRASGFCRSMRRGRSRAYTAMPMSRPWSSGAATVGFQRSRKPWVAATGSSWSNASRGSRVVRRLA